MTPITNSTHWEIFAERCPTVLAKIESFSNLKPGWDYGDGVPFATKTISIARDISQRSLQLGFTRSDAFPGTDGTIQITIYEAKLKYIVIMIRPSGAVSLARKINNEKMIPVVVDGSIRDTIVRLREIAIEKWNTYDFFIPANMTASGDVTPKSPFVITSQTGAHPLLTSAA